MLRTDPFCPGSYSYNRPPKDCCLLRSTPEVEGYSCLRNRCHTNTATVAPDGLPGRIVRDICALW